MKEKLLYGAWLKEALKMTKRIKEALSLAYYDRTRAKPGLLGPFRIASTLTQLSLTWPCSPFNINFQRIPNFSILSGSI